MSELHVGDSVANARQVADLAATVGRSVSAAVGEQLSARLDGMVGRSICRCWEFEPCPMHPGAGNIEQAGAELRALWDRQAQDVVDRWWRSLTHYLRTAEQYDAAPNGTEVALPDDALQDVPPWLKVDGYWRPQRGNYGPRFARSSLQMSRGDRRRVLKWGDQ